MPLTWLKSLHGQAILAAAVLCAATGVSRADDLADLKARLEAQQQQIEALKQQVQASQQAAIQKVDAKDDPKIDEKAVQKIVGDYLKDHPGAGMPSGVETGYSPSTGFVIRSPSDPAYVKWDDECKIPFSLQIRGRVQLDYYNYKVIESVNHLTGAVATSQNANTSRWADFSQEEVKRLRLQFLGTLWDPNLRYWFELDGNTRGLAGIQNNKVIETAGVADPNGSPVASVTNGGVTVDHAVRLFSAYVAYDMHPCFTEKGCGPDCPQGSYSYTPTVTAIFGKLKPMMSFEEYMGSGNQQFVEYNMADWFFDADDDNLQMAAGFQYKFLNDRFYAVTYITNGYESQFPNVQEDKNPGVNVGFWYDFGGTWNEQRKRYDLFGDSISDIDYSCKPVVRVGGAYYWVNLDRRSIYGDDNMSRIFLASAAPGGSRMINIFDGGAGNTNNGVDALDKVNVQTFDTFVAGKWHGFSLMNEWLFRDLSALQATQKGNALIYNVGGTNYLYPTGRGLFDYGSVVQGGYFVIPKKLEVVGRFSFIRGESGDINGNGKFSTVQVPGVGATRVAQGAFTNFHESREYAVGLNYYFKRQLLKWSTDFSIYQGGNPAAGGSSPAGFISGEDGYQLRTQIQLAF